MKYLAFDIETIPNQLLPKQCIPIFDPESIKYGNTKDPAKRMIKEKEELEKFNASITKTMSLDPAFCSICTFVGRLVFDKSDTKDFVYQLTDKDGHDDLSAINIAVEALTKAYNQRIPIVSFNGLSFDLPVIFFRAILQDVPIDTDMWQQISRKYTNPHHYDLMQIFANWDRQRWHKQDFYASLFNISSKNDVDGSMVFDLYQTGEYDKIKEYCASDVDKLSQLFERAMPWVLLKTKKEDTEISEVNMDATSKSFEKAGCIK